jgi:hypothetical protein
MITVDDIGALTARCRQVPRTENRYVATDYVSALLDTVLDYQMHTNAVRKAIGHFNEHRWDEVRTLADLKRLLARYPDDRDGNEALAGYLWSNRHWTRAHQLRGLTAYFDRQGVDSIEKLRDWAATSDFRRDFEGHVKGLGPVVYRWLVMRLGVETVKPDVHLRRFVENTLGRRVSEEDIVEVVCAAARELDLRSYELDWSIWEHQRTATPPDR